MSEPFSKLYLKFASVRNAASAGRTFLEATEVEIRMLLSALGKYALADLGREDVGALDRELADALNVPFVYAG